jgi:hypothetical protein
MGCYHGHGYHAYGCWGPGDCRGDPWGWEGYGPGYGYGPRFSGRYGAASRETAAARLEAYLASLQDEIRAIEADLAEMRSGGERGTATPQV